MAKGIIIELDCLLDTRLALVYALDGAYATSIINTTEYCARKKDNFGSISLDIFKTLYRNRSKQLLDLATPTNLMEYILPHIAELKRDFKTTYSDERHYNVFINVYPYSLNMVEILALEELYSELFNVATTNVARNIVKLVTMTNEELLPEWLDENVECMVMYYGMDWLEYHISNLNLTKTPLIDIGLVTPALGEGNISSDKLNAGFYKEVSKTMKGLISYQPIPVEYFCSMLAKKNKI